MLQAQETKSGRSGATKRAQRTTESAADVRQSTRNFLPTASVVLPCAEIEAKASKSLLPSHSKHERKWRTRQDSNL